MITGIGLSCGNSFANEFIKRTVHRRAINYLLDAEDDIEFCNHGEHSMLQLRTATVVSTANASAVKMLHANLPFLTQLSQYTSQCDQACTLFVVDSTLSDVVRDDR